MIVYEETKIPNTKPNISMIPRNSGGKSTLKTWHFKCVARHGGVLLATKLEALKADNDGYAHLMKSTVVNQRP